MIAMQYSLALPADYDMTIIDRRIRDKGALLDGFAGLRFKAYLSAQKRDEGFTSTENLYAPFYLWDEPDGLSEFLTGSGFATLTRDFGWPVVRTWVVWHAALGSDLRRARSASREIIAIQPHADLGALRAEAVADAERAAGAGAIAAVAAFDPASWTMVRFRLWSTVAENRDSTKSEAQIYRVGYVALP